MGASVVSHIFILEDSSQVFNHVSNNLQTEHQSNTAMKRQLECIIFEVRTTPTLCTEASLRLQQGR
jgi:hypothetical protein